MAAIPRVARLRRTAIVRTLHFARQLRPSPRNKPRLIIGALTYLIAATTTRLVTHSIHEPQAVLHALFHDIDAADGTHVHHVVFGILAVLGMGVLWLAGYGSGTGKISVGVSWLTASVFGIGAALVLDEFALVYFVKDVYWQPMGTQV